MSFSGSAAQIPAGYSTPSWPSLYLPWKTPYDLYYLEDVWKFTVYWTLLFHGVIFGLSGAYSAINLGRGGSKRLVFALGIPVIILLFQELVAFVAATILGFALGAIYTAAYLRMSTWVPFLWVLAQTCVTVASSYTVVDVLL